MISRRSFALGASVAALVGPAASKAAGESLADIVGGVEKTIGCRFGVAVSGSFGQLAVRGDERFPLCSTFKLLAAAAILKRVDEGRERLDRRVIFEAGSVVAASPVTSQHVGGQGMALAEICEAAITRSDNTAGNLMLAALGGPAGLTRFARQIGDSVTRLDRIEPDLNEAIAGDPRDTTSPAAMLGNLRRLATGTVLSRTSRDQLCAWLGANKTGDARLRAGFPHEWVIGDKTGTGENGAACDVAIVWPPSREPVLITAYLTETSASLDDRNAAFASVARWLATRLR